MLAVVEIEDRKAAIGLRGVARGEIDHDVAIVGQVVGVEALHDVAAGLEGIVFGSRGEDRRRFWVFGRVRDEAGMSVFQSDLPRRSVSLLR